MANRATPSLPDADTITRNAWLQRGAALLVDVREPPRVCDGASPRSPTGAAWDRIGRRSLRVVWAAQRSRWGLAGVCRPEKQRWLVRRGSTYTHRREG